MTDLATTLRELRERASPDWQVVGGNRIAYLDGPDVVRIAEFFTMTGKGAALAEMPAEANARLAACAPQMARVCEAAAVYKAAREIEPDWLVVEQAYDALCDALAGLERDLKA